jgi:hypothetical protein
MDSRSPVEARTWREDRADSSVLIGSWLLIPGYPQWSWNQKERAFVLFGSYLTAILVAVLTWGTGLGLGVLAFAFATHVFSAVDAIRQNAFPGFGRLIPTVTTSAGLGAVFYAPALVLASVYAWPISLEERPREGYLVNRWAYRQESPRPGETVWIGSRSGPRSKVARIVATSGQRLEWVARELRIDGQLFEEQPFLEAEPLAEIKLTIPVGHLLVVFPTDPRRGSGVPGSWEIVEQSEVRGRAWARSYPFWERGLLRH